MDVYRIIAYVLAAVVGYAAYFLYKLRFPPRVNVPIAPGEHWLTGHLPYLRAHQISMDAHTCFNRWQEQMGDRYMIRIPGRHLVVLSDAPDIHAFLTDRETFHRNTNFTAAFQLASNGLLVLDGDVWHAHRKLVQPAFSPDYLREACRISNLVADKLLARWENVRKSDNPIVDAHSELSRAAMDIIGLAAFDQNFNSVDTPEEPMSALINRGTQYIQRRVSLPPWAWRFLTDVKEAAADMPVLRDFVITIINNRKEAHDSPHRRTVLDMLLEQRKQASGDGFLNDQEIKDEIIMLYLAGHETTGNTMSWVLLCLTKYPEIRRKVQEELKRVLNGGQPGYDDLAELTYLEQVVKETLRLYPVVPLTGRQSVVPTELNGMIIPANVNFVANFHQLHRNPKYWPEPLKFDPDRFHKDVKHVPNTFLPFGDGPKNCVGKGFAMVEIKTMLARILQKYEMPVTDPAGVTGVFAVTLGPKEGLKCRVVPASL